MVSFNLFILNKASLTSSNTDPVAPWPRGQTPNTFLKWDVFPRGKIRPLSVEKLFVTKHLIISWNHAWCLCPEGTALTALCLGCSWGATEVQAAEAMEAAEASPLHKHWDPPPPCSGSACWEEGSPSATGPLSFPDTHPWLCRHTPPWFWSPQTVLSHFNGCDELNTSYPDVL